MDDNFRNIDSVGYQDLVPLVESSNVDSKNNDPESTSLHNLDGEVWKDLEQYEGFYAISNYGRLKRYVRFDAIGRKLQEKIIVRAYSVTKANHLINAKFTFGYNNKVITKAASILVAEAFIGEIPKGHCVVHLDKNTKNDKLENIAIMSYTDSLKIDYSLNKRDNSDFGIRGNIGRNKIVEQYTPEGTLIATFNSLGEVRKHFGFRKSIISKVCLKNMFSRDYSAYGFRWAFQEML